jgi:hypothetical protein
MHVSRGFQVPKIQCGSVALNKRAPGGTDAILDATRKVSRKRVRECLTNSNASRDCISESGMLRHGAQPIAMQGGRFLVCNDYGFLKLPHALEISPGILTFWSPAAGRIFTGCAANAGRQSCWQGAFVFPAGLQQAEIDNRGKTASSSSTSAPWRASDSDRGG